ncbi:acyl-homoserine-lactone synthase [Vibrio sinaloensis]|uniref:acyl-homoserine-lactone synthase n=1 Tax=Photobacterium sp. (strain ATCC 43367) TaxID=379097 RepID=UPI0035EB0B95
MAWNHQNEWVKGSHSKQTISLFEQIRSLFGEQANQFFLRCMNDRLSQVCLIDPSLAFENIATQFSSKLFQDIYLTTPPQWDSSDKALEQEILLHFSHWAEAWAHYQIWSIVQKYKSSKQADETLSQYIAQLPLDEVHYQDKMIHNVEQCSEWYYTIYAPTPMTLGHALALINLSTLVVDQEWYEILEHIDLSTFGMHFILSYQNEQLAYPIILSSAKVNTHNTAQDWLYFSTFFQNRHWAPEQCDKPIEQLQHAGLLQQGQILSPNDIAEFDRSLWNRQSRPQQSCEIIRLTVSGSTTQKLFFLYLSQKRLMQRLVEHDFLLAFVVIEQPLMIHYYNSLANGAYYTFGSCIIANSNHPTYKGVWVVKQLNSALSESSFRQYKQQTFSQLRHTRSKELNHA